MELARPARLIALAAVAAACTATSATVAPEIPIDGCGQVLVGSRCDEVVQAANAGLDPGHPAVAGVRILPPNDRQAEFSGVRPVEANVRFDFADGTSATVAVVCRSVTATGPRCSPAEVGIQSTRRP